MALRKTGILGAAFDPVHYGHMAVALAAQQYGGLRDVWLVPSPARWDKTPLLPGNLRCLLLQHMIYSCRLNDFYVCQDELQADSYRGSFVFMQSLQKRFADREFFFIVGSDAYASVLQWRDAASQQLNGRDFLRQMAMIVVPRINSCSPKSAEPTLQNDIAAFLSEGAMPPIVTPFLHEMRKQIEGKLPQDAPWEQDRSTELRALLCTIRSPQDAVTLKDRILKSMPLAAYNEITAHFLGAAPQC